MGPGEVLVVTGLSAALLIIVLDRLLKLREKMLEMQATAAAGTAVQYGSHSRELEARVRVLEQIVTDRPSQLASEIDALAIDKGGNA